MARGGYRRQNGSQKKHEEEPRRKRGTTTKEGVALFSPRVLPDHWARAIKIHGPGLG
jgi:hypothetical protein